MTFVSIVVTLGCITLAGLVAWYFWFSDKKATRIAADSDLQEALIKVKGGYTPDLIVVKAGRPVRLNFLRQETATCSETVIFPDFQKSADLPPGEIVPIEFIPEKPGEYQFNCQMGMLRGKLIVE